MLTARLNEGLLFGLEEVTVQFYIISIGYKTNKKLVPAFISVYANKTYFLLLLQSFSLT